MALLVEGRLARTKIVEFLVNCEVNEGIVTSKVKAIKISFDNKELGES